MNGNHGRFGEDLSRKGLRDLKLSVKQLEEDYALFVEGPSEEGQAQLDYRVKNVIRCLLGSVDGISYFLRQTTVDCAPTMGVTIAPEDLRSLRKVRNPRGSLQQGYKFFGQLAGLDLAIDTTSREWQAFDELVEVRHGFSHPTEIRGLFALRALHLIQPTLVWFMSLMSQLFSQVGSSFGSKFVPADVRDLSIQIEEPVLRRVLFETFNTEFFDLVAQSAGRSIAYLRHCMQILNMETDSARSDLLAIPSVWDPRRQYQARLLAWSLSSNIEGMTNLVRSELEKAVAREEIGLTDADRESMAAELVEDRAGATAEVWSREVGYATVPSRKGEDWTAVSQARGIRNRISHPKKLADLRIDQKQQVTLLRGGRWFMDEFLQALLIHPDKWIAKLKQA